MFIVSGPELVDRPVQGGYRRQLPALNAREKDGAGALDLWLNGIAEELDRHNQTILTVRRRPSR